VLPVICNNRQYYVITGKDLTFFTFSAGLSVVNCRRRGYIVSAMGDTSLHVVIMQLLVSIYIYISVYVYM